jgi:DNA-binding transcriptional regulator YdaS (Cro superfamily)
MESNTNTPLEMACAAVHGSSRLAELLSARIGRPVAKSSVSQWKRGRVPAERCPDIEAITGIRCEELRPDVDWSVLRKQTKTGAARKPKNESEKV